MAANIAVVIPTYNRAGYLKAAIDSVLAQTQGPSEIVVVDDGSTDETQILLAAYGNRIQAIRQDNLGQAAARNRGVAHARAEWIAFLDSDDAWEPGALARLTEAAAEFPGAGLFAMKASAVGADGRPTGRVQGKKSPGPFFTTRSILMGDAGGILTPMVRRSLFVELGGFDTSLRSAEDVDLWLRMSFATVLVGVPDRLLRRRVHATNLSADRAVDARSWISILDKLAREHPEFVRDHAWPYRRALGKERLRLGRELLAASDAHPERIPEARAALRSSIASFPFFGRAWLYLVWSVVAPGSYAAFRRFERRARG
jgi:glycosyltransferase involved in cell wall biosynthesis